MKKMWNCGLAACLVLFMSSAAFAQDYEFSVAGPASFIGGAGSEHAADYSVLLGHMGEAPAAQGWSFGLEVQGGVPTAITMEGTDAEAVFSGEFINNGIIDPANNDGKEGVVSAVVLTLTGNADAVLPANAVSSILFVSTTFTIPESGGTGLLAVVDGLQGVGQPVDIVVTEAGDSKEFTTVDTEVVLTPTVSCGPPLPAYGLGFATESIRSVEPFAEGFIGAGEADGQNSLVVNSASGVVGRATLFPTISSNVPEGGVQGWSISIESTGAVKIVDATTDGTSSANVPDGRFDEGFGKTELALAENNDGRVGVVSAIALCLGCGATLDPVGTESVLQISVEAAESQGPEPQSGRLSYASLTGSGQLVDIVLTVDGMGAPICNRDTVGLDLSFEETPGKGPFVRGDANDDARVDLADGVWIIAELFGDGPDSVCQSAADANADGLVDLADPTYLFGYQFAGGPAPEAPFPECDLIDIDADDLECPSGNSSCR